MNFQQTNYGIERLEVTDGHHITRSDIQNIVDYNERHQQ